MNKKAIVLLLFFCFIYWNIVTENSIFTKLFDKLYDNVNHKPDQETFKVNKTAYLTFDDGPSSKTGAILDVLDQYNVKATFFLIGSQIEDNKELVSREIAAGHSIGIHTFTHKRSIYSSVDSYITDAMQVKELLQNEFSINPTIYRFPWGSSNGYARHIRESIIEEMQRKGLNYFDWDVSAEDSSGASSREAIIRNIKKDLTKCDESIILMHDSEINELTAKTLPEIIEFIRSEGYDFDVLY